jgi:plasmid maintenance system antidote protein VapI
MGRRTELKDKTRNNIFAAAIDEIRRREGKLTQLDLAKRMGVNKDTITNILRYRTAVTDDIITRLQNASGRIFNLQWLRGESDIMLSEQDNEGSETFRNNTPSGVPTYSSMTNSIIAAKDEAIESLKREVAAKDLTIESQKREVAAKNETIESQKRESTSKDVLIESLQQQVADLRAALAEQQKKDSFGNYPFTPGVADNGERVSTEK